MSDLVHNFVARKQKHERAVDAIPEVARGEGLDVRLSYLRFA